MENGSDRSLCLAEECGKPMAHLGRRLTRGQDEYYNQKYHPDILKVFQKIISP